MKKNLEYIHTRLEVEGATLYLAVNKVENVLEVRKPVFILDNEKLGQETVLDIQPQDFSILKEAFELIHGKELQNVSVSDFEILSSYPLNGLEDAMFYATIDEVVDGFEMRSFISMIEKNGDNEHSIEITKEVYEVLSNILLSVRCLLI